MTLNFRVAGCSLLAALLVSQSAIAASSHSGNSWFVGVGGGNSWIGLPSSDSIFTANGAPPPANHDLYKINDGHQAGVLQLLVGYRWLDAAKYLPAYSVAFQYTGFLRSHISGRVHQFSSPVFDNYNFKMDYTANMFTLNGKFNLIKYYSLLPYLSAGAGLIINHVNNYDESAVPPVTARTSPGFEGNTQMKLAGILGAGIDLVVTDDYWLTLGYEHVFQGDIKTGRGTDTWSETVLSFGNMKMDTLFVAFTANFPHGLGY